jgi:hypothetical protein
MIAKAEHRPKRRTPTKIRAPILDLTFSATAAPARLNFLQHYPFKFKRRKAGQEERCGQRPVTTPGSPLARPDRYGHGSITSMPAARARRTISAVPLPPANATTRSGPQSRTAPSPGASISPLAPATDTNAAHVQHSVDAVTRCARRVPAALPG